MINMKTVFNKLCILGILLVLYIVFSIRANNIRSIDLSLDNIEALAL